MVVEEEENPKVRTSCYFSNSDLVYSWKNREVEWYNSERRFIFTCKSSEERNVWIRALRQAIKDCIT